MTRKTIARLAWSTTEQQKIVYAGLRYLHNMQIGTVKRRLSFLSFMERHINYSKIPTYVAHGYSIEEKALWFFNQILGTYGVECIRLAESDKRHSYRGHASGIIAAEYLNVGETYTPTLVYRFDIKKRWDIISWGDLVEILERKGYKLA